jgi:hypothetical protein
MVRVFSGWGLTTPQARGVAAAVVLVFGLGLARVVAIAWICDDAFISLRYAANLVQGHGLVYNPGEYVEGYTNLLWTLLLAASLALGWPDVGTAQALGIAAWLALLLVLFGDAAVRHRREGRAFVPLAAACIAISPDFQQWATGGLETSLFALLALGGLLLSRRAARGAGTATAAGVVLALATLTRPDGILFAVAAAGGLAWERRPRAALHLLAPVALTVAGWAAFKLHYYGELFPTAFYSKSALDPYYSQGLVYLGLYLWRSWFVPAALCAWLVWRLRVRPAGDAGDRDAAVYAGSALLYVAYVVHAGGDFMYARRILPAVPLLLLALEIQLLRVAAPRSRLAAAALCVLAAALPWPLFADAARIRGVADESYFYPARVVELRRQQGEAVGSALRGAPVRVMFEGGMCVFGYYSGLPYLVEMTGLTQYSLARQPLERRGFIGHEKQATEAWLTENGIHLVVSKLLPPVPSFAEPPPVALVRFGDAAVARIHRYDPAVMERLARAPGVEFVPIERTLERMAREIDSAPPARAEAIYAWLERFYFDGAGEAAREVAAALRARVDARRAAAAASR